MKRVLIVNDEMVVGGVARVLVNMLNMMDVKDVQIDLLILHPHGEMLGDIPEGFNILKSTSFFEVCDVSFSNALRMGPGTLIKKGWLYFLMKTGLIDSAIKREREKIIKEEYDVEIAYKEGFCTLFVANGNAKKKVNWIHVDYKKNNYSKNHMGLVKEALSRIDINVAQSDDAAVSYKEVFGLSDNFMVIRNFINEKMVTAKASLDPVTLSEQFNIVTVGRLHYQKAILRMMEVCRRLKESGFEFHYYVVGDGEEREAIEKKIAEYKLSDVVTLVGYDANPYRYMKAADLFLLPSIYESAPTVVYEALALRLVPVLSCEVAGVREQLNNGEFGMICENSEDGLYGALSEVLSNPAVLNKYKMAMLKYVNTNNEESNRSLNNLLRS